MKKSFADSCQTNRVQVQARCQGRRLGKLTQENPISNLQLQFAVSALGVQFQTYFTSLVPTPTITLPPSLPPQAHFSAAVSPPWRLALSVWL